jgi:repressor of nif and glnA expression
MPSRSAVEAVVERLGAANLCNLITVGKTNEPVCEIPVRLNKVGLVIPSGLNAVAVAAETGIDVTSRAMNGVIGAAKLKSFWSF